MIDDEIEALYALPPTRFIAARDALAKQLTQVKDRDGARRVRALEKPSPALWAANRLHFEAPLQLAAFEASCDALALAQTGSGTTSFRDASLAHQRALSEVSAAVAKILDAAKLPATAIDKAQALLRTLALDPASRRALASGALRSAPEEPGLDALSAALSAPARVIAVSEPPSPVPAIDELALRREAERARERERLTAELATLREREAAQARIVADAERALEAARAEAERVSRRIAELVRALEAG